MWMNEWMNEWKCIDFKCFRKATKSRLIVCHTMQTNSAVEQNKNIINCSKSPWNGGIRPVGDEKVKAYGGKDLPKNQVFSSEWKTGYVDDWLMSSSNLVQFEPLNSNNNLGVVGPVEMGRSTTPRSFLELSGPNCTTFRENISRSSTFKVVVAFLPRCMECRRGLAMRIVSVRLSVRLSVKRVDCDKTKKKSVRIFIPYERQFSLFFWEKECLVGGDPFYLKFWVNRPPLERNRRFWTDNRS